MSKFQQVNTWDPIDRQTDTTVNITFSLSVAGSNNKTNWLGIISKSLFSYIQGINRLSGTSHSSRFILSTHCRHVIMNSWLCNT